MGGSEGLCGGLEVWKFMMLDRVLGCSYVLPNAIYL